MMIRFLSPLLLTVLLFGCSPADPPEPEGPTPRPEPERSEPVQPEMALRDAVRTAMAGAHRSAAHQARDDQRNPEDTLAFLGLERGHRAIEIWPGGGWYTEILAPVLRDHGQLVVANYPPDPDTGYMGRVGRALLDKLEADPDVYGQVEVVQFALPDYTSLGASGSADFVLLSRQFHGLAARGQEDLVLAAAYDVLRSGGVLGIVQHRLPEDRDFDPEGGAGYVPESFVIAAAARAGFELEARSEVNANPRDTADHEHGVWTLPPSFRACAEIEDEVGMAECRERYQAIGESDRMTLRFVKP
ncbi:MAG: class I SAM-dependent methyltransferase [Gammaproteobacteria bacterium]|nr:class I SAM-dependent methyltransferase [Gammaproteobacteria bacterium]